MRPLTALPILRRTLLPRLGVIAVVAVWCVSCSSAPTRDAKSFCAAYVDVASQAAKLGDPDELAISGLKTKVAAIDDAATEAVGHAPDDISDAARAVVEPLHNLRDDLDNAKDRESATVALRRYRVATSRLVTDQKQLDAWVATHCDVVPVTTTTTVLPPTSPGSTSR